MNEIAYTVASSKKSAERIVKKMGRFAAMYGYTTVEEWNKTHKPLLKPAEQMKYKYVVYRVVTRSNSASELPGILPSTVESQVK